MYLGTYVHKSVCLSVYLSLLLITTTFIMQELVSLAVNLRGLYNPYTYSTCVMCLQD